LLRHEASDFAPLLAIGIGVEKLDVPARRNNPVDQPHLLGKTVPSSTDPYKDHLAPVAATDCPAKVSGQRLGWRSEVSLKWLFIDLHVAPADVRCDHHPRFINQLRTTGRWQIVNESPTETSGPH
jgi:hypothetical protein